MSTPEEHPNLDRFLGIDRSPDPKIPSTPDVIKNSYVPHVWVSADNAPYENLLDKYPVLTSEPKFLLGDSTSLLAQQVGLEVLLDNRRIDPRIIFLDLELEELDNLGTFVERFAMVNTLAQDWRSYPAGSLVLLTVLDGKAQWYIATGRKKD